MKVFNCVQRNEICFLKNATDKVSYIFKIYVWIVFRIEWFTKGLTCNKIQPNNMKNITVFIVIKGGGIDTKKGKDLSKLKGSIYCNK